MITDLLFKYLSIYCKEMRGAVKEVEASQVIECRGNRAQ